MRLEQAFSLIQDVEAQVFGTNLTWSSINLWPLIRQCLWLELIRATEPVGRTHSASRPDAIRQRIFNRIIAGARALRDRPTSIGLETTAFISRPEYLQALPNGDLFDRIVDPLIFSMPGNYPLAKYYVAPWPKVAELNYAAALLRPSRLSSPSPDIPEAHRALLIRLAEYAGVEPKRLLWRYGESLKVFARWLKGARLFFDSRKNLNTVYLTSWYFPDMMALVTAARERGIKTIELQHGKQGKFQAMYSGWSIPEEGYLMMPDIFWSWGRPSAEHILATSSDRFVHRPIVGGFPWLDYYRQHISSKTVSDYEEVGKRVLITIQSPQGDNNQPIPDFLLDFLRESPRDVSFIFRCHPNDQQGLEYCRCRLSELPVELYKIDNGCTNLYDSLMMATHHITAYSSCSYEADAFGVPTLLYGVDAKAIYKDEIENGIFSWTPGSVADLALWLDKRSPDKGRSDSKYISSSLEHTSTILRNIELGEFDFYKMDRLEVI